MRAVSVMQDDDIGSGLFWCANIASSFQFDAFILLSALPQCLFLFGLQAKYYLLMLFVQVRKIQVISGCQTLHSDA